MTSRFSSWEALKVPVVRYCVRQLGMWMELMQSGAIPLIKVLASDGARSGEFQFKHKSFQEALFVEAVTRDEHAVSV